MLERARERFRIGESLGRPRKNSKGLKKQKLGNGSRLSKKFMHSKEKEDPYGLMISIKRAEDLPPADSNGLSDPYVRFYVGKKSVGRTTTAEKTLNPLWEEEFFTKVPDFKQILKLEVWDYDRLTSAYLGEAEVDLAPLFNFINPPDESTFIDSSSDAKDFILELVNRKTRVPAGRLHFSLRKCKKAIAIQKPKKVLHDAVTRQLVVDLIEAKDLTIMDDNGKSDPFCVLSFQGAKAKSKVIRFTTNPTWKEQFDFAFDATVFDGASSDEEDIYNSQRTPDWARDVYLKIDVMDRDTFKPEFMGSVQINVMELAEQNGEPNDIWVPVRQKNGVPSGYLHLIISILDVSIPRKLTTRQLQKNLGSLRLYIIQAKKPKGKGFKRVTYVEASVGSYKLRTQNLADQKVPSFERMLEFPVKDIFSVVEISLWERKNDSWEEKGNLVGKIVLPLLELKNKESNWHVLKNTELSKAVNAQIRIAADFTYNYSQKLLFSLISRHETNPLIVKEPPSVNGVRTQIYRLVLYREKFFEGQRAVMGILRWDYGFWPSVFGMIIWFLFCMFYQHWFVPLLLLGFLMYTKSHPTFYAGDPLEVDEDGEVIKDNLLRGSKVNLALDDESIEDFEGEPDELHDDEGGGLLGVTAGVATTVANAAHTKAAEAENGVKGKKAKMTLAERFAIPMKLLRMVQHNSEDIGDVFERTVGLFTWASPTMTEMVAWLLLGGTILLLLVPLPYVLIGAVEWQFVKQGLRKYGVAYGLPDHYKSYIPALEFLAKIPTSRQKMKYAPVRLTDEQTSVLDDHNFTTQKSIEKVF